VRPSIVLNGWITTERYLMDTPYGAQAFQTSGTAYDGFMGRYSRALAPAFAEAAGVEAGQSVLDVGCGPGALTGVLVERLGPTKVSAVDPSPTFVSECATRHPGIIVRHGRAEDLPFEAAGFDRALAQLVLHFVTDPVQCAAEFRRVLRPDGVAAACVWDSADGMQMLRSFWDAALAVDPQAPDEARVLRFAREGEISDWLRAAGFHDVTETTLEVSSTYASFAELWQGFLAGIGPAGSYCVGLPEDQRVALREELFHRLDSPTQPFSLTATARCASGRTPG
jgi:SAM-dependent methyltransferase